VITGFDQYAHLSEVDALVRANPQLRITVGMDYLIRPDVTVGLGRVETASGMPPLHAAALEVPAEPGLTIIAYTVEPASPSEQALPFLASWASETHSFPAERS
jgi:hypothetical protein